MRSADLENDPEVAFVSVDHPVKGMDEYTNAAMNVRRGHGTPDTTARALVWP